VRTVSQKGLSTYLFGSKFTDNIPVAAENICAKVIDGWLTAIQGSGNLVLENISNFVRSSL